MPRTRHSDEMMEELIIAILKFFDICSALTVGKIMRDEMSIVPIALIPRTMVTEVKVLMR